MEIFSTKGVSFPNGQPVLPKGRSGTQGGPSLRVDNPLHMTRAGQAPDPDRVTEGFAGALNKALGRVEELDTRAQKLTAQSVYDPDSVDAHTVILAAEKARFALNLTKTVADGAIRAYRELTSGR